MKAAWDSAGGGGPKYRMLVNERARESSVPPPSSDAPLTYQERVLRLPEAEQRTPGLIRLRYIKSISNSNPLLSDHPEGPRLPTQTQTQTQTQPPPLYPSSVTPAYRIGKDFLAMDTFKLKGKESVSVPAAFPHESMTIEIVRFLPADALQPWAMRDRVSYVYPHIPSGATNQENKKRLRGYARALRSFALALRDQQRVALARFVTRNKEGDKPQLELVLLAPVPGDDPTTSDRLMFVPQLFWGEVRAVAARRQQGGGRRRRDGRGGVVDGPWDLDLDLDLDLGPEEAPTKEQVAAATGLVDALTVPTRGSKRSVLDLIECEADPVRFREVKLALSVAQVGRVPRWEEEDRFSQQLVRHGGGKKSGGDAARHRTREWKEALGSWTRAFAKGSKKSTPCAPL